MDFTLANHGSIFTLNPLTPAAEEWIYDHIPDDAQAWGKGIVIEPRYVEDIVDGIRNDGLELS